MASLKFLIQSSKETANIYLRLRDGRSIDLKAKTNLIVRNKDWNYHKGTVYVRNNELKALDAELSKLKLKVTTAYNEAQKNHEFIDPSWLKSTITDGYVTESHIPSYLLDYIDYYLLDKKNSISPNTLKKIKSYKVLLTNFESWCKRRFKLSEIDGNFKMKLEAYGETKNYGTNYLSGIIHYVKILCRHAERNGVKIHDLRDVKIPRKHSPVVFLTLDEIEKIFKLELEFDYLDNARDWLVISCDTAQRVSDFMRFTRAMISERNGRKYIEFRQVKTGKLLSIALSPRIVQILEKRDGEFPREISDQRYNEYIKTVAMRAGLTQLIEGSKKGKETKRMIYGKFPKWELVTSHIGRRSWATNYFGKYSNALLMSWTGHSTEKDFLRYIGKSNLDLSTALADQIYN
jgi:hypothetical protein